MGETRDRIKARIKWLVDRAGGPSAFAEFMGLPKQNVNNWVNGPSVPDLDLLGKIAEQYGVPLSYIVDGPDDALEVSVYDLEKVGVVPSVDGGPSIWPVFSTLNETGKKKVIDYAEDLASIPKYQN